MSIFAPFNAAASGAYHVVAALAAVLHPACGALAAAAAIVLFTVAVRLALHPLVRAQVRGERARTRLAPRLQELSKRHRGDPAKLRAATAELYAREQVSPLVGCLPTLLQAPFFSVLIRLFSLSTLDGQRNTLMSDTLFGVPLGSHITAAHGVAQAVVFLGLYALLTAVAYVMFRRARRAVPDPTAPGATLLPYLSFGTVLFAALLPVAAGLYLLTTTAWTAAERGLLNRAADRRDADQ
jgi:YidC/Oxa1 family membrane protein insertase